MLSLMRISRMLLTSLFTLPLFGIMPDCCADTSASFDQAAADERSGNYAQAEQAYQSILANVPGSDDAFRAQKYLAMLYIGSKQNSKAQQAITQLTANFASRSDLAAALHGLSVWYGATGNLDNSKQLCQTIIQDHPGSPFAQIAGLDKAKAEVISAIQTGSFAGAQSQLDKISQDFAQQPGIPAVFYEAVEWCERSGNPVQAKAFCQKLIQRYSGSPQAQMAALDAAGIDITAQIESGNYTSAKSAADAVMATYSGRPGFVSTLTRIADAFNGHGQFEQSCSIYDALLGSSLASVNTGQIDQAAALIKSGNYTAQQYASARDTYQRVLKGLLDKDCFSTVSYSRLKAGLLGSIQSKEFEKTGSFLTQLETGYSDKADFPVMLYAAAIAYEGQESYHNQAGVLYDRIIQQCPATEEAELAKFGKSRIAAMSAIKSGDYAAAESAVNAIDAKFQSHLVLPCLLLGIADGYEGKDDHDKANVLYDRIIQQYPATEQADLARFGKSRNAVLSAIKSGDYAAAESAMNAFDAKLQSYPEMPCLLYAVANGYESKAEQDKANVLYDRIIQQYSATEQADLARFGKSRIVVLSALKSGDYAAAESAMNADVKLQSHPEMPCLLYAVANGYESKDDGSKANALYDQIVQKYPAAEEAGLAKFGKSRITVMSAIKSGDYAAAESAINVIDTKYQSHPVLPCLLYAVANGYESKAEQDKANVLYDRIVQQYPATEQADLAKFGKSRITVLSALKSGDYAAAESAINVIDTKYQSHPVLPCLLYAVASGYASKDDNNKADALFDRILQQYPGTESADLARFGKSRNAVLSVLKSGDYAAAESAIDAMDTKLQNHPEMPCLLYAVANGYESKAEQDKANVLYDRIIQQFPAAEEAGLAKFGQSRIAVMSAVKAGDYAAAESAINAIDTKYQSHSVLPCLLYAVASGYASKDDNNKANVLYDRIIQQYPATEQADLAKFGKSRNVVMSALKSEDYAAAESAINAMDVGLQDYPEMPCLLYAVANGYASKDDNNKADALYDRILQQYPGTESADLAKFGKSRNAVLSAIKSGDYAAAESAMNTMDADLQNHPEMPCLLYAVANGYESRAEQDKANALYDQIVQRYPAAEEAGLAKFGQSRIAVMSAVKAGDYAAAESAINAINTKYQSHPVLPCLLYAVASGYASKDDNNKANVLYDRIIQQYPATEQAGLARFGKSRIVVLSALKSEDYAAAESAIDAMDAGLQDYPEMPCLLYAVANGYESKDDSNKANALYDQIVQRYPAAEEAGLAKFGQSRIAVMSAVKSGDYAAAESATNAMDTKSKSYPEFLCLLFAIANGYESKADYENATRLYDQMIQQYPATEEADLARFCKSRVAIISLIQSGDLAAADAAASEWLANSSEDPETAWMIYNIANHCQAAGKSARAEELYRIAIAAWMNQPDTATAWRNLEGIACASILLGDFDVAKTATDKLFADFPKNKEIAASVHDVANQYQNIGRYEIALDLYQKILQLNPTPAEQLLAHAGIARVYIRLGDKTKVQEEMDLIFTDYKEVKGFDLSLFPVAEEYYLEGLKILPTDSIAAKACFIKSAALFESNIVGKSNDKTLDAPANYMLGLNYQQLGDYAKAAEAFQNAYQADPKFKYADYCLFAVGDCYEKLLSEKRVSEQDALAAVTKQYQQLIKEFPDSSYKLEAESRLEKQVLFNR